MTSSREKFKFTNTMVCLLKAMEYQGVRTTVELRNENSVHGKIELVTGQMHMTMSDVIFKPVVGPSTKFSQFFVQGHMIRFVHIPDHIDIRKIMEKTLMAKHAIFDKMNKQKARTQKIKEQKEIQRQKREAREARILEEAQQGKQSGVQDT